MGSVTAKQRSARGVNAIQHSSVAWLLLVFAVAAPRAAEATSTLCDEERSGQSATQLVVHLPEGRYEEFVQLIESGDIVPVENRLQIGGRGATARSIDWYLSNPDHSVLVFIEYFKVPREFVFWVQTCNTTDTWQSYWRALTTRVHTIPGARVEERAH